ncbi:tetratricopeptide repeat protein [Alisedimentitalea sp. MJ-SS2]|uniref:tetratricopeptide repeat protein n=1 Tax=Aliisedimentitalea sp. MJ-SS2 TaxID=3049795 RepID=UPI0029134795|nr:tetratricopeptide repeat protein [Alisedimentitalea sp. MJ-SS2]MDU8928449.1 tetratricopeptide repeat protein [Alisedimentitalea sp. MJ-SS2]
MKPLKSLALVALVMQLGSAPAVAEGLAGAYLAGRQARFAGDFQAAADYYTVALARDPSNPSLMEATVVSFLSLGRIDRALPVATVMEEQGLKSQLSHMVLLADEAWNGRYDDLLERIADKRAIGDLVDGLIAGWSHLGKGAMSDAIDQFDAAADEPGQRGFAFYHKALALAMVGDFESAEEILGAQGPGAAVQTRRGVIARLQVLSQLDQNAKALEVLEHSFGTSLDPELAQIRDALTAGETLDFTIVTSVRDGISEVLYSIAGALRGEARGHDTILFARLAEYLRPGHIDAILLSAEILDDMEQFDLATEAYRKVPRDDPAFHAAELGRAEALRKADKPDAAIEVLEQLAETHGDLPVVHNTLGDLMRTLERYEDAIGSYDRALALYGKTEDSQWFVYYARGICHERTGDWPQAEADFRKALEIDPDRPEVLNYLGYSLVEKSDKLDEALELIERAVAARPDSGYIVDSLGWALYRLGRYDEAVGHMERAAELMSIDPIVNDHLGDVYWAVGRYREAEFQWKRALSFVDHGDAAEDANPDRIRRKLEVGLDKVLAEEGAAPLKVAGDDG